MGKNKDVMETISSVALTALASIAVSAATVTSNVETGLMKSVATTVSCRVNVVPLFIDSLGVSMKTKKEEFIMEPEFMAFCVLRIRGESSWFSRKSSLIWL